MNFDFWVYGIGEGLKGILDNYESIVWKNVLNETGECEITAPVTEANMELLVEHNVLVNQNPVRARTVQNGPTERETLYEGAIITYVSIDDEERMITAKAMTCDHLMSYRQCVVSGEVIQSGKGVYQNLAIMYARAVGGASYWGSTLGDAGTGREFDSCLAWGKAPTAAQWSGGESAIDDLPLPEDVTVSYKNLRETVSLIMAQVTAASSKVFFDPENACGTFAIVENTAYDPDSTDSIAFSDSFESLFRYEEERDITDFATVAQVAGEGEDNARVVVWAPSGVIPYTGLDRREIFVDARDLQSVDYDSDALYKKALVARGIQKLVEPVKTYGFEIPENAQYKYREDFYLGDEVGIVVNDYNVSLGARVAEVVETYDGSGYTCNVSFGNLRETLAQRINKRITY